MQLDFKSAFAYHPLFFIPPTVVMILLYKNKINPRVFKLLIAICVVALLVVYIYRMLWHTDEIVVFEPQNGLVVRLFCS